MASLLRQLVAGPRARHPEAGLDLCYVTDRIIATSGPSKAYPQRAYRNPLDQLVAFLDSKHGDGWAIWEFRAEGTGYPDEAVYGRVRHYPWPDHHPPPFRLVPLILAGMRTWLHGGPLEVPGEVAMTGGGGKMARGQDIKTEAGEGSKTTAGKDIIKAAADKISKTTASQDTQTAAGGNKNNNNNRVVVVHCKAGKGRSGTVACSYLIAEEGWQRDAALARFTQRRMRPRFGSGVSIPSQLRWISYVDRWANTGGKHYVDRAIEVVEIHVWGLRHGVRVGVEGFVDDGRSIQSYHTFDAAERIIVESAPESGWGFTDMVWELAGYPSDTTNMADNTAENKADNKADNKAPPHDDAAARKPARKPTANLIRPRESPADTPHSSTSSSSSSQPDKQTEPGGMAVILRPQVPIRLPHSDVNIAVERRNRTNRGVGLTMVSAVAHVWFNAYFEGHGPDEHAAGRPPPRSGVFAVTWDDMDGIKGSSRKGARALDRMAVVWRVVGADDEVDEPAEGSPVPQLRAADWTGEGESNKGEKLGLRALHPESAEASRASSASSDAEPKEDDEASMEGVRCSGPEGEEPLEDSTKKN